MDLVCGSGSCQPHAGVGDQDVGAGVAALFVHYPEWHYMRATSQFIYFLKILIGCFFWHWHLVEEIRGCTGEGAVRNVEAEDDGFLF